MFAERFGDGDVLCSPASDALFLVIEAGTARSMPFVNGRAASHGSRQPCSQAAEPDVDCDLRGGQRYVDLVTGLQLLCIRPGQGPLYCEGRLMTLDSGQAAMSQCGGAHRPCHLDSHAVTTVREYSRGRDR